MLPSFVSNLFWGVTPSTEQEPSSAKEANEEHQAAVEVEHTAQEDGDWLLITRSQESAGMFALRYLCIWFGDYSLSLFFVITVILDDHTLYLQVTYHPSYRIFIWEFKQPWFGV